MKLKLTYLILILLVIVGVAVTSYMIKRARQLDDRMRREGYSLDVNLAEGRF